MTIASSPAIFDSSTSMLVPAVFVVLTNTKLCLKLMTAMVLVTDPSVTVLLAVARTISGGAQFAGDAAWNTLSGGALGIRHALVDN